MQRRSPGQWLKQQIRIQVLIWVLVPVPLLLIWMATGRSVWVFLGVTAAAFLLFEGPARRQVRNRFLGAVGEISVARALRPLEARGYRIFHDLSTASGNIDHVVIGPTGVFVLETKAWRGRVYPGKGGVLMRNGQDASAAVRQAEGNAMQIRRRLQVATGRGWVNAYIVLTRASLVTGPIQLRHVRIVERRQLLAEIVSRPGSLSVTAIDVAEGVLASERAEVGPQQARRRRTVNKGVL